MPAPTFTVSQFSAPDHYIGATSNPLPCTAGDLVTFTASIRLKSGGMQPIIGVWFWDATQANNYGSIRICPPNTDSGWHNYTFTFQVPSPAVTMTVETYCEYITLGGIVNTTTTDGIVGTGERTPNVTNTTGMVVGQNVTIGPPVGHFGTETVQILAIDSGVSFTAEFEYSHATGSTVVNTFPPETCYFVGFWPAGYAPSLSEASQTVWEISNYRLRYTPAGQAAPTALYAPLVTFNGSLTSYLQLQEFIFPLYYLSLLTSMYQQAPNFYAWLSALLVPYVDLIACTKQMYQSFALPSTAALFGFLNMAQGSQLDIIGQIVGIGRTLPFQPGVNTLTTEAVSATGSQTVTVSALAPPGNMSTSGMQVGEEVNIGGASPETVTITAYIPGVSFTAVFANTHLSGVPVTSTTPPSAVLDDADFVTLLQAKIAQNQWNGLIGSVYAMLNSILPGSGIILVDNANMTVTVFLTGGALTPMQEQLVVVGLIIPRPQGVLYTFEYATLPAFGWETTNTAFVAAWGVGNFVG